MKAMAPEMPHHIRHCSLWALQSLNAAKYVHKWIIFVRFFRN